MMKKANNHNNTYIHVHDVKPTIIKIYTLNAKVSVKMKFIQANNGKRWTREEMEHKMMNLLKILWLEKK